MHAQIRQDTCSFMYILVTGYVPEFRLVLCPYPFGFIYHLAKAFVSIPIRGLTGGANFASIPLEKETE